MTVGGSDIILKMSILKDSQIYDLLNGSVGGPKSGNRDSIRIQSPLQLTAIILRNRDQRYLVLSCLMVRIATVMSITIRKVYGMCQLCSAAYSSECGKKRLIKVAATDCLTKMPSWQYDHL